MTTPRLMVEIPGTIRLRDATIPEVVAWLREQGAVEEAESTGVTFDDVPEGKDGLILAVDSRRWVLKPAHYLIIPIDAALSPTSQEGE